MRVAAPGPSGRARRGCAARRVFAAVLFAALAPVVPAQGQGQGAESALPAWLRQGGVPLDQIGLVALPVDGDRPLLSLNAQRPLNPASTMKLVTSYASLGVLGPGYRWHTGAFLKGRLEGDVLRGDLVLRGGGDPKLVVEDLTGFVAQMRAAGLRDLQGDLVIDDALYDVGEDSVEHFDGEPSQPYNVRPFALLMNFKATRVVVQPAAQGPVVTLDPALADVRLEQALRPARGGCRPGASAIDVRDGGEAAAPLIRISGAYAPACGEQGVFASVLSHRQFVHAFFKAAWLAAGGQWTGNTRIERGAGRGAPWLDWVSPRTLADVVRDVNKFSNNVMARQLLLQLAVAANRVPATVEAAGQSLVAWLNGQGLVFPELVVENGSGLSRSERISPASLAALLRHAAASPHAELMRTSLPLAGFDGTMKHRLTGDPVAGSAWIKTGSLADVRAIAGYVDAASGRRYAVVLMVNGPQAERTQGLQDQFLRWVHRNG
jgi:D-alanyl-D-alanine carboxypeptidase/D-alanyl-D-alanine-endopeptidase (penicillin-binding protein 4)